MRGMRMSTSNKQIGQKKNNNYDVKDLLAIREVLNLLDTHQVTEAKSLCLKVLKKSPTLVFANNAMGLIALSEEQPQVAENYFKRALSADPKNHEYITSLGESVFKQGRIDDSIHLYNSALTLMDEYGPARIGLATALQEKNDPNETIEFFLDAVKRAPNAPGPYSHLGKAYIDAKRYQEAISALFKSLELQINFAAAHTHLAIAFREMHMLDEALECNKTAIILEPDDIFNNSELANTYIERHEYNEATKVYEHIIELAPTDPNSYAKLASHLYDHYDQYNEAIALFNKAIDLDPKHALTYNNIGAVMHEYGNSDEAISYLKKALTLKPNYLTAQHNLALAELQMGDYKEGWINHESRLTVKERKKVYELIHSLFNIIPMWDGKSSLKGKSILLMHEQGFGDSIQFARYALLLQEQGVQHIYIYVKDALVELFKSLSNKITIIRQSDPLPKCDFSFPLMSLPLALGTDSPDKIPACPHYLHADPIKVKVWEEKIEELSHHSKNLRVGIIWAGNPEHGNDKKRSIPLKTFSTLFSVPGVDFYALQKGELPLKDLTQTPEAKNVINLGNYFEDFSHTAAAIECMDLVISVDTSVTHLAGALNKKTWTLLAFVSDWRWLKDRNDSPWYPNMRLFRQTERNNWPLVLKQVSNELSQFRDETLKQKQQ